MNDSIIKKYGKSLNWYQLLLNQHISEDILELFLNKFIAINLLIYVLKYQKLSLNFLLKHKNIFLNNIGKDNFIKSLNQNNQINSSIKNSFLKYI